MICFVLTHGREYTLNSLRENIAGTEIRLITYDQLIRARSLPCATYVFIDLDRLSYFDLELAAIVYRQLRDAGLRVLNDPAVVKKRYLLLRALSAAGINHFNAYLAAEMPANMQFPVFIRKMQGHGVPETDLLEDRAAVDRSLAEIVGRGVPLENLIVIEYAGEPIRPGIYRKMSVFRVADTITSFICGHDRNWLVKVGEKGLAGEELYRDEARIVRDNPYAEQFRKIFDLAHIEYGRADFSLRGGRVEVFEINTNPMVGKPVTSHPFPMRVETMQVVWENVVAAITKIDSPAGPAVRLPRDVRLNRFRRWHSIFTRSRVVD